MRRRRGDAAADYAGLEYRHNAVAERRPDLARDRLHRPEKGFAIAAGFGSAAAWSAQR